jgi:ATP-binding cassette subfamily F protein 3
MFRKREYSGTTWVLKIDLVQIVGDETTALESVLRADVWRHKMLTDEAEVHAKLEQLEQKATDQGEAELVRVNAEKDELAARLGEIQKSLLDMEAETGPARASSLLAGLGFNEEDQRKTTKSFSGGWR